MKQRPDLAIEEVDGELVVLDKAAGMVHQLNSSASFVWHCVSDGLAVDETALRLSEEFDVEKSLAVADVMAILAQFEDLGLLVE